MIGWHLLYCRTFTLSSHPRLCVFSPIVLDSKEEASSEAKASAKGWNSFLGFLYKSTVTSGNFLTLLLCFALLKLPATKLCPGMRLKSRWLWINPRVDLNPNCDVSNYEDVKLYLTRILYLLCDCSLSSIPFHV